jgi:hypothetical protein
MHLLTQARRDVLPDVVELDRQLAVPAVDEPDHLHGARPAEIHQGIHGSPNRPTRLHDVIDEHHHMAVHRRGHFGASQGGALTGGEEIVAVERGVEHAHGHLEVRNLAQVAREAARQGNAPVRDRHQVELVRVRGALDDLVGNAHEGAPDALVIEKRANPVTIRVRARCRARGGLGGMRGGLSHRALSPPHGTELKERAGGYWEGAPAANDPRAPGELELEPSSSRDSGNGPPEALEAFETAFDSPFVASSVARADSSRPPFPPCPVKGVAFGGGPLAVETSVAARPLGDEPA